MSQPQIQSDWRKLFRDAIRGWSSNTRVVRLHKAFDAVHCRFSAAIEHGERGELNDAIYFLGLLSMAVRMEGDSALRTLRARTDGRRSS